MKDLPRLKRRSFEHVEEFAARMLTNHEDPRTALRRVTEREDNAYRAIFEARYFILSEGETEPTKSQWNSLKKRFKRSAPDVFLFKEHGECDCADSEPGCYYLDFGYFAEYDRPNDRFAARPRRAPAPFEERRPFPRNRRTPR